MPRRSPVAAIAAAISAMLLAMLLLAALCACAPATVTATATGPKQADTGPTARPDPARRLALAAFHLRDERGGGPAEALKALDEPAGPGDSGASAAHAASDELALRAVALNQLGRYAEAVAALDALMLARRDLPPSALADAFVERGLALGALGHQDRAREDFAAALVLAPRHIPALLARADQLFALGQPGQAEAGYSQVIEIDPDSALALINRGVTRDEQGRFAEAIDDFSRALKLDPLSPAALVNRGVSRSQTGDLPGMCADYQAACGLGACARLKSARGLGFCLEVE